ncbi:MAG: Xaa-Pro dipeptidase [Chlamydiae bacterium]|nr:Xaa-Pro dipeptidase [Chlamydiota bacterium]
MEKKIQQAQALIQEAKFDGWLLYDWQAINPLALKFLEAKPGSRRFFYFIPQKGECIKLVHQIEQGVLDHLPGEKRVYLSYGQLENALKELLKDAKTIAMETSEKNRLPYVSKVDAGTIDLIRSFDVDVTSSAYLILPFETLNDRAFELHKEAMHLLEQCVQGAKKLIKAGGMDEYAIQQWILKEFEKHDMVTHFPPIVAVNSNAADPHYFPNKEKTTPIQPKDFVLIDLWCKKNQGGIYADITQVLVFDSAPTKRMQEIFAIVKAAQQAAIDLIQSYLAKGATIKGYEVDQAARKVITDAGFGKYFFHRLGHNIDENDHGSGTHLDSLETFDDRPLIKRTLFSIEPGIYIPGEIGVRLECNAWIDDDNQLIITGGLQDAIFTI